LSTPSTATTPPSRQSGDDEPVVYIGEGTQLGYLPETVRKQLGW